MTLQETAEILSICKAEWPQSFARMSPKDGETKLNLWAAMFEDDDVRLVGAAVKSLIVSGNREFAPNVGQIKEQMRRLTTPDEMGESEAWSAIHEAIRNGLYGSNGAFAALPPLCRKVVGSPSQLREWAALDSDELNTVVASNVQRAYRTMQQRENENAKLPQEIKTYIAGLANCFLPEGGSDGN